MIGYIAGVTTQKHLPENAVRFLKTGVCGGFTTFSTFSLEAYTLSMDGKYTQAGLYAVLSVGLCLFGIFVGMYLSKAIR